MFDFPDVEQSHQMQVGQGQVQPPAAPFLPLPPGEVVELVRCSAVGSNEEMRPTVLLPIPSFLPPPHLCPRASCLRVSHGRSHGLYCCFCPRSSHCWCCWISCLSVCCPPDEMLPVPLGSPLLLSGVAPHLC